MLIICSGPDTYRARTSARELADVFREKFDPSGKSVERIDSSQGINEILNKLGATSLFSSKKFIRTDDLLKKIAANDVTKLDSRLASDNDQTVLVTVEENPPSKMLTDKFKLSKIHKYDFPKLQGDDFRKWVREKSVRIGLNPQIADKVAESFYGDSWAAINELEKQSANPQPILGVNGEENVFRIIDNAIAGNIGWRRQAVESKESGFMSGMLFQMRSYARVKANVFEGIQPFVVKKMRSASMGRFDSLYMNSLAAFVGSRSGICDEIEAIALVK